MGPTPKYSNNQSDPNYERNMKSLQYDDITKWSPTETLLWLLNNINCRAEELAVLPLDKVTGKQALDILRINREDFIRMIPDYGQHMYDLFQSRFQAEGHENFDTISDGLEFDRENAISKKDTSKNANLDPKFLHDIFLELKNNIPSIKIEEIAAINFEIMENFNYHDLKQLSLEEFKKLLPALGENVYFIMQKKFGQEKHKALEDNYISDRNTSVDSTKPTVQEKRKRGRPRGSTKKNKPKRRVGHVWEFLLELLLLPDCGHIVSWQNRATGVFQFNDSKQVAKLWGDRRDNPKMNFGKLSRSIRHNYKKGYLLPVPKRLVYKFGPRSKGWQLQE